MKNSRLLVPIIAIFTLYQAKAELPLPKLVVWLTVDELRTDYLETLLPEMQKDGMAKLLQDGLYFKQLRSPLEVNNGVSAMAMLQTGQLPYRIGISERSPVRVDKQGRRSRNLSAFYDENYLPYASTLRLSPKALLAPSLADRLKAASAGRSRVFSFALLPEEALLQAGHKGDAAYWLDAFTGKWASTTYYPEPFPWFLEKYNNGADGLRSKLAGYKWTLSESAEKYKRLPYATADGSVGATVSFGPVTAVGAVERFRRSALSNDEMARVLLQFVKYVDLGKQDLPDLLSVHLSVAAEGMPNKTLGIVDAYYRVDKLVAELVRSLNAKLGAENVLYVLCGNGIATEPEASSEAAVGTFYTDRCKALLNMYLIPLHGKGNWVEEVSEHGEVFLNSKEAKRLQVPMAKLEADAADFLQEFSGVQEVLSREARRRDRVSPGQLDLYRRTVPTHPAALLFRLAPGWRFAKEQGQALSSHNSEQAAPVAAPLILSYGRHLQGKVSAPLYTTSVAAAIAYVLRIRPPNPAAEIPAALLEASDQH